MPTDGKIPIVAAMATAYGKSYDDSLRKYNALSRQEQANLENSYVDNNMGYGPEAWSAYCDAKKARGESW